MKCPSGGRWPPFNWHLLCSRAPHTQEMNGFTSLTRDWEGSSDLVMSNVSLGDWLIDWQSINWPRKSGKASVSEHPLKLPFTISLLSHCLSAFYLMAPFLIEKFQDNGVFIKTFDAFAIDA